MNPWFNKTRRSADHLHNTLYFGVGKPRPAIDPTTPEIQDHDYRADRSSLNEMHRGADFIMT